MSPRMTEEDEKLWGLVTRTIKAMQPNRSTQIAPQAAPAKPQPPGPGPKRRAREAGPPAQQPAPQPRHVIPKEQPISREVDARTQMRLRRGQMEIEARIDLHGHSVQNAYFALRGFISEQFNRGARCVLVIHGKGSLNGEGKIRREMPHWLNEWRDMVLQHSYAKPQDGGDGASYVLLRRKR